MLMNQEITQLNSLTSSVKIAENDHSKIKEKYELIIKDEKILDSQYKELEGDYNKEKERFAEFKKKIEEEIEKHNNEINEIENKLKDRTADRDLYFELKTLESEIKNLQNDNNFLEKEISDVGNGLNTPGYRIHLHKNLTEEEKTKLLEQLSKNLVVQKHQGFLTLGSIKSIFDATILYHSKDFIVKTYRDRIERRKVINNDDEYVEIVLKHLDEFDSEVDNAQLEFLKKIGMTLDDFSKNIEFYFTNGNQDIYIMTTQVPQKLKLFIQSRKKLSLAQIKEILQFEKEILPNELELFKILQKKKEGVTPDIASTLISHRLSDKVYEKFNVEEEDLMKSMQISSVNADVETVTLLKDIRNQIYEKLPSSDPIM